MIRTLAIGLAIAALVFLITAGHVIFLPLLFLRLACSASGIAAAIADTGDGTEAGRGSPAALGGERFLVVTEIRYRSPNSLRHACRVGR